MISICKIVREALTENFLSITAEDQVRECLRSKQYTSDDLRALRTLQNFVISGVVKQESRILRL